MPRHVPLEPGLLVAHYRIGDAIGAGGMGEVYRAADTRLGRDVALKVLPADVGRDPERLGRFEREARAVAALNHPNIVTLYSIEESEGLRFLTMEVVEGSALDAVIPADDFRFRMEKGPRYPIEQPKVPAEPVEPLSGTVNRAEAPEEFPTSVAIVVVFMN